VPNGVGNLQVRPGKRKLGDDECLQLKQGKSDRGKQKSLTQVGKESVFWLSSTVLLFLAFRSSERASCTTNTNASEM
jgi:hypothetical protein